MMERDGEEEEKGGGHRKFAHRTTLLSTDLSLIWGGRGGIDKSNRQEGGRGRGESGEALTELTHELKKAEDLSLQ